MKSEQQYFIDYLKDGVYILVGHNPINNQNIVLAKADSPSKLLEHGYIDMGITQAIDMSGSVSAVMDLETISSMGGLSMQQEMMKIIEKLISNLIDKKTDEENYYE